jgi:hypothetical protein
MCFCRACASPIGSFGDFRYAEKGREGIELKGAEFSE